MSKNILIKFTISLVVVLMLSISCYAGQFMSMIATQVAVLSLESVVPTPQPIPDVIPDDGPAPLPDYSKLKKVSIKITPTQKTGVIYIRTKNIKTKLCSHCK